MCTVVENAVHSVHPECTHIYTKHKSVAQAYHTGVKTICTQIQICTKTFCDIVLNYIDIKFWYVSYNFVGQTIHTKVKVK